MALHRQAAHPSYFDRDKLSTLKTVEANVGTINMAQHWW